MNNIEPKPLVAKKKFYFSAAIRGDTSFERNFRKIIEVISKFGEPLTERSDLYNPLDKALGHKEEKVREKQIYRRDMIRWLGIADAIIAEISGGSVGVGYEIRYAIRDRRIPVFCLYHESSKPSLIVKQDPSKYVILQTYSNADDIEKYLTGFLTILDMTENIEDIRSIYGQMAKELEKSAMNCKEMEKMVENLLAFGETFVLQKDLTNVHIAKFRPPEMDFKDVANYVGFMFKNLVLQKRWDQLKSQRIGATFVSGRKRRIIAALTDFYGPTNLLEVYKLLGEHKLRYTKEAFTKNIRAYRRIGLFKSPAEPSQQQSSKTRSTKFKDKLVLTRTLEGQILLQSSRSPREIMRKLIIPTSHLVYLSSFLGKYGTNTLEELIGKAKRHWWFVKIPDIQTRDIDSVNISDVKEQDMIDEITRYLETDCKEFWQKQFSSFA